MFKREKGARAPLSMAWWKYALVAVSDVEANFLLVKAFGAGATITSVMLLDCATIPFVLILSYCFLAKVVSRVRRACMRDSSDARIPFLCQYSRVHMAGACMCVVGLSLLVESDILSKNAAGGSSSMLGDVLVILGSASYSLSNVAQEAVVKHYDRVQYATAQLQPPPCAQPHARLLVWCACSTSSWACWAFAAPLSRWCRLPCSGTAPRWAQCTSPSP
jgi:hypothetical protein